jgi:hypothetical protein
VRQTTNPGTTTKSRAVGWVWRLLSPEWHQELLALALIIMTVAVGCLVARH